MSDEESVTSMKEIEVGGQKFMVPDNMAAAIEAQNATLKQEMEDLKATTNQNQKQILDTVSQLNQPAPEPEEAPDGFWDNPNQYIQEQINQATSKVKQELTSDYQAKQAEDAFWDDFYKQNDDLKDVKFMVDSVSRRDLNELTQMGVEEAKKTLADRTRKELLKLKPEPTKVEEVVVEPSSFSADFNQEAPKPEKNDSLSDIIRKGNKARREARKRN